MRVGIFFGGQSREREISFVGGRTIYDSIDKSIFEPIPIFVDSLGNFILLNWQYLYKGSIRDFYPPPSPNHVDFHKDLDFQIYVESVESPSRLKNDYINSIGTKIYPHEFSSIFDFAFLSLHGTYGEDGCIQGLLEWYGIPYSGTSILGSAIGIDKGVQKYLSSCIGEASIPFRILNFDDWIKCDKLKLFDEIKSVFKLPFIIKSTKQGSSIGVSLVSNDDLKEFIIAVNKCFFVNNIDYLFWQKLSLNEKKSFIRSKILDIRYGISFPVVVDGMIFYSPNKLLLFIENHFSNSKEDILCKSLNNENEVLIEYYIEGKEFSCIVVEDQYGNPASLPPTELITRNKFLDYKSKYLPGFSRKKTPIDLPLNQIQRIKSACEKLFIGLNCEVFARVDGFIDDENNIYLNDPNTTSGMNPSSFWFHQAAEIGLNPSEFITFIIKRSLEKRIKNKKITPKVLTISNHLDQKIKRTSISKQKKIRVGVLMGGFTEERHVSMESGRNVYSKLLSSSEYNPIPIFLSGTKEKNRLFILPINILLKDHADDIHKEVLQKHDVDLYNSDLAKKTQSITDQFSSQPKLVIKEVTYDSLKYYIDFMFIALHGRPGEDGEIQSKLEKENIPYNGSSIKTCRVTMDKYLTNQLLKTHGITISPQFLIKKQLWIDNKNSILEKIEKKFTYPLIAKPTDEGCSAAVVKIENRKKIEAYCEAIFRTTQYPPSDKLKILGLDSDTYLPKKQSILTEIFVEKNDKYKLIEVTGGLLTHYKNNTINYEIFEPSESLALDEVLSLEEKFLAGEGQNVTPARYSDIQSSSQNISNKVKHVFKNVAKILNIEGYARIDAFVKIYDNEEIDVIIIEVNTLPALTPATCIFHQCAIEGYKPLDFIQSIIKYGIKKHTISDEK